MVTVFGSAGREAEPSAMEKIAERLLELLKTDAELRDAVLRYINASTDAKTALADMRRRK